MNTVLPAARDLRYRDALSDLHTALLLPTLENSLRCPFYRQRWDAETVSDLGALTDLPFTYRNDVVAARRDAQIWDGQICDEKFTGGTTRIAFPYVIGRREQKAVQALYDELYSDARAERLRRAVRFSDTHVAFERTVPVPIRFHNLSAYGTETFGYCRQILSMIHNEDGVEDRCTILTAGERILRALTQDTLSTFPNGFHRQLEFIFTYGFLITKSLRDHYESTWGARLVDRYGLAEVMGGATEDLRCGWYHFDPTVLPEVVGPFSKDPVREGVGMLVLTPLYPFQESQPLVRYWTDDLVQVTHTRSSIPGLLAIRPLGRAAWGIPAQESDEWLMRPDVVYEVMESRADVQRAPILRDSKQVVDPFSIGLPQYHVSYERRARPVQTTLHVGRRDGAADPTAFAADIRDAILSRAPRLAAACAEGDCAFHVLATN